MGKRALLSVSDKTGILDVARRLIALGYTILSTGGTQKTLQDAGISVTAVEDVTKFPECFSGRVKTMHPLIMGGILMRPENAGDVSQAKDLGIEPTDLVIVNLYPFKKTMEDTTKTKQEIIEQIDIGGPTLLRSAAKNHECVTVVCDVADYERVLTALERGNPFPRLQQELAAKVFAHTAAYDSMITEYLSSGTYKGLMLEQGTTLRYGENPHQWGKFYQQFGAGCMWQKLQGKELSYLNLLDADGAWLAALDFPEPTAVFVKHANPSGIASHASIEEAFQRAYDADRLSAFGVIIALNRPCTTIIAQKIIEQKIFVEVVIAPSYDNEALEILKKKPNIRLLGSAVERLQDLSQRESTLYRSALGGMLVQDLDQRTVTEADLTCVTDKKPTKDQIADLLFAWKAVKYAKSNAIVFAKDRVTVGIGAGQTSRVDATWIAAKRAGEKAHGAVMASDAFFPFPDSVEEAAKHGIAAIIQPGGSIRDEEVFQRANTLGLAMVTTGVRAFRH